MKLCLRFHNRFSFCCGLRRFSGVFTVDTIVVYLVSVNQQKRSSKFLRLVERANRLRRARHCVQAVRLAPYVAAVQRALFWSGGSKRFLEARILTQWLQPTKRARGRPHAFPIGILCRQPLAISGGLSLARLSRLALSTPDPQPICQPIPPKDRATAQLSGRDSLDSDEALLRPIESYVQSTKCDDQSARIRRHSH